MIEAIQQSVKLHDQYQVEIKLDYELLEAKQTYYKITTYFFLPQSLGITKDNYSKANFYRDVQNYIRLKTPSFILRDFTENLTSPLAVIEKMISVENWTSNPKCRDKIINQFKILSAMLKSSIRDHFKLIEHRIDEANPGSKIHLFIHNLVEEFLVESQKITDKFRSFYPIFNRPNVDTEVFTAYAFTDESISLLFEESAVEMSRIVVDYSKKSQRVDYKQQLNAMVKAETKHRRSFGYPSILSIDGDNEEYVFRTSVLKKYAASVLYLSTAVRREGVGLEQMLFAIAAGISMIFATLVAFYFQWWYGNFTFAFFIALVIGYMFKDRIKEIGRTLFSRYLDNKLYDRRIVIKTQDGKHKLGTLKEKVRFIREDKIPNRVIRTRNKGHFTDLDNDGQGENVIRYTKEVVLYTDAFKRAFVDVPNTSGINDIMRYDIRAYLNKMADPIQEHYYLQEEQLLSIQCHKVYHLNIIYRYASPNTDKDKLFTRTRLVLNREGIKRIEHVPV